jgi:hypothetical protein
MKEKISRCKQIRSQIHKIKQSNERRFWDLVKDKVDYENYNLIFANPNMSLTCIEKHFPKEIWSFRDSSRNPNLTINEIKKYPDAGWYSIGISSNPAITMADIENHLEYKY